MKSFTDCFKYLKRLALFKQSQRMIYLILIQDCADGTLEASMKMIFEHSASSESILVYFLHALPSHELLVSHQSIEQNLRILPYLDPYHSIYSLF